MNSLVSRLCLELELDGFYKMEGEGGGAWSWVGASTISSQVLHLVQRVQRVQGVQGVQGVK